ncbi:MAG: hypothetical protein A3C85_04520 [Candidatus Doudnabacteria bacterium RIFCSPHIGHO2_02_FULL_48_21]|uniref:Glycosyl transferase family 1 domain-containing protein n=1 Tax=Candidatus Doudnabacteria bacterium RIFCSPLOWO2_02_FULL_48_13 TaxID=1817845 RepID=A0A1F5QC94_9BACT|nr:MAG: hypothetical protein A3K05_00545 [Candidatus Doudnabacteria bacterium RIFCSPHIGHO2_01_48_18]OGE91478.1 MAG: hypothetical protein A3F44_01305 [Candidatus Doudnabacteria bacterium RIFCSPHIGHO2_12_FULL_47_25]OGE93092.1 MAG: hypothetical protein A3C85_04520 [Candidatus Doudnabacteria bacterium RIFCSPHIGHO2_02_FULL_48_21]OGE98100.1 MAG: hypothetical protein A3A83_02485 [Candidatus Doudnabacteria bacterium RIFCSPLOWO2_01_FULL_48_57]OGE99821.1 MAG: hypothetical protein A3J05_02430 [Candidatus 
MIFFFKFPLVPSFGGAEFHTLSLALEMRTRGQQTMLVTSDPYLFRLFEKHGLPRLRMFAGWEPTSKWSLLLWPATWLIAEFRLGKLIKHAPADSVFYCQSLTEKLVLLPQKCIFLEHKIPGRWLKWNPLKFWYLRRARTAKLVTVSQFAKQEFIKLEVPENNIEVVNPSLSVIARSEAPRQSQFTIGILGRLDPEKGVFGFLTSVIPHLPDAKVIIAGDGFEKKLIEQFIDENNLRSQIKLIGFIYDLGQFFFQISALVYPTKVPESYGIAAAEAIARGIPVVASNIGALPEIVKHGENGFLVERQEDWIKYLTLLQNR